jgi:hypothetical protein
MNARKQIVDAKTAMRDLIEITAAFVRTRDEPTPHQAGHLAACWKLYDQIVRADA